MQIKHIVLTAIAGIVATSMAYAKPTLTVVSFGGAYSQSQINAYHKPFTKLTGIKINAEDYNGGLAEIRVQSQAKNVVWDVVDMPLSSVIRGCEEGILEPLNFAEFPKAPDGTPAEKDFLPETMHSKCAAPLIIWSTIFAYDKTKFPNEKPQSIKDFFDIKKFPGRRALRKNPRSTLEFAMMASGVEADKVYETLSTPEGLKRAFATLDKIKDHTVWWEAGSQPPLLLADGEVVMATAYNGRIFNAWNKEKKPFEIVWNNQVWYRNYYAIVKGTPHKKEALEFIKFSSDTQRLADQARHISYGPARKSSMKMISTHIETGIDMRPHMPTNPKYFKNGLESNYEWWADYEDEVTDRFNTWLAK